MCPSQASTPDSVLGRRRSISDRSVQDSILGLLLHIEALRANRSSLHVGSASSRGLCRLPLSRFQSLLLGDLVTTSVPRLTWWSMLEENDSWVLYGVLGEDSGPQLTVCITATSDKDVKV